MCVPWLAPVWRSEDNLWRSVLSFHHVILSVKFRLLSWAARPFYLMDILTN